MHLVSLASYATFFIVHKTVHYKLTTVVLAKLECFIEGLTDPTQIADRADYREH